MKIKNDGGGLMSGIRWLFISEDCKVYRTYEPKNHIFKPIKELANQEVLEVILFYETNKRKPYKLLQVWFDRLGLDFDGGYVITDEARDRGFYNFIEYGFETPEELAIREKPLTIPIAPIIPTNSEKEALYKYLKEKIPALAKDAPLVVERCIKSLKQNQQNYIDLIKQAKKMK
jgi:hypothetical protein